MRFVRKVVFAVMIVAAIVAAFVATLYACQWHYRSRAKDMLAAVCLVQPGMTTQSQYLALMKPFPETGFYGSNTAANGVMSSPRWWPRFVYFVLPGAMFGDHPWIHDWTMLAPTVFEVYAEFRAGRVSSLSLREMQGSGHPVAAFVEILPGDNAKVPLAPDVAFSGYFKFERNWNDRGDVHFFRLTLDDRATSEERRKATEFSFSCFTTVRACLDAKRMLMPAPARKEQARG